MATMTRTKGKARTRMVRCEGCGRMVPQQEPYYDLTIVGKTREGDERIPSRGFYCEGCMAPHVLERVNHQLSELAFEDGDYARYPVVYKHIRRGVEAGIFEMVTVRRRRLSSPKNITISNVLRAASTDLEEMLTMIAEYEPPAGTVPPATATATDYPVEEEVWYGKPTQ